MKNSFKSFLIETEWSGQRKSFYNLYYWDYKPKDTMKNKDKKDENEYKELLTHFLRNVGSINK